MISKNCDQNDPGIGISQKSESELLKPVSFSSVCVLFKLYLILVCVLFSTCPIQLCLYVKFKKPNLRLAAVEEGFSSF